jgi:hypothetical protein
MSKCKLLITAILFFLTISINATYHKIGSNAIPYFAKGLAVVNSTALVSDSEGLHIINTRYPHNPEYVGCYSDFGSIGEFIVEDNIAYLINGGVLILDVSNPQDPQFLAECATPDFAKSFVVRDSLLYVAAASAGLVIIDVSNPTQPEIVSNFETYNANIVEISGDLAFIVNYMGDIVVIDISDVTNPTLVNLWLASPQFIRDIKVIDSIAYVGTTTNVLIYDITDPTDFSLLASFDQSAGKFQIENNTMYLISGSSLVEWDITNMYEPILMAVIQSFMSPSDYVITEDIIYMIDQYSGLNIYNASEYNNPELVSNVDTPSNARGIAVYENTAYIADGSNFLQIADISDLTSPEIINSYGLMYYIKDVIVEDNFAFVLTGPRLYILRLNNPVYPELACYLETDYSYVSFEYYESHIYLSTGNDGFIIVNVEDPFEPEVIGECDTFGYARDICVSDNYVFVSCYYQGLQVVDTSDLSNPIVIESALSEFGYVYSATKVENILYLMCSRGGLKTINIETPSNPIILDSYKIHDDSVYRIKPVVIEDKLILADENWNEIVFFDISTPDEPVYSDSYNWNLNTKEIIFYNDFLLSVNGQYGFSILDLNSFLPVSVDTINQVRTDLYNHPNPFNPSTTISFSLSTEQKENAEIQVYNTKGQKVDVLSIDSVQDDSVVWNAKRFASGVYFYKLVADGKEVDTRKMLLLK